MEKLAPKETTIVCRTNQGIEIRASVLRLARHLVVFELHEQQSVLRTSEVLDGFKILLNDRPIYSGKALVSNLFNTGSAVLCEATLKEGWIDVQSASPGGEKQLGAEFSEFVRHWQNNYKILPEFKLVVADMHSMLSEMRLWLEQVEVGILAQPADSRQEFERKVIGELQQPILSMLGMMFEKFEESCKQIEPEMQPAHRAYVQRLLHADVLCAPFMYRTYKKPLGYAGDYEMVNMIMRDPIEGGSLFAKILNVWFLNQPPAVAHRNRIQFLIERIIQAAASKAQSGRPAKILSLGCGPAMEIQRVIREQHCSDRMHFTLIDFNEETLVYTRAVLEKIKKEHHRTAELEFVKKSVFQIFKEAARAPRKPAEGQYDLVYCAGLFDYLTDAACHQVSHILYEWVSPGGLLITTNVDSSNPRSPTMDYIMEWNLIYRSGSQLAALRPAQVSPDRYAVTSDTTGVNIYFEARKPNCEHEG